MASAGYWGKLPNFPDFIKYNSGSDEVQDFDKWLNEGLYSARQKFMFDWEQTYLNSGTFNFVFPFGSKILTGIIYPGKDKSRRLSPFIRFSLTQFENEGKLYLFPLLYSGFYLNFDQFLPAALKCSTNEEVASQTNNIADIPEEETGGKEADYFSFLYTTKINDIIGENVERKVILFNNLTSVLSGFNSQSSDNFKLGLRFPVAKDKYLLTSFWMHCSQIITGMKELPYLFWNAGEDEGFCYLFPQKPGTHFYPVLLKPGTEQDNIVELDNEGSYEKAKNNINSELLELVQKEDSQLISVIQFLTNKFSRE